VLSICVPFDNFLPCASDIFFGTSVCYCADTVFVAQVSVVMLISSLLHMSPTMVNCPMYHFLLLWNVLSPCGWADVLSVAQVNVSALMFSPFDKCLLVCLCPRKGLAISHDTGRQE
jgi:hypothetical protein